MIKKYVQDDTVIFDKFKDTVIYQTLVIDMKGKDTSFFSYSIKEILTLLTVLIPPIVYLISIINYDKGKILPENKYKFIMITGIFLSIVAISLLFYTFLKYIYRSKYLNKFRSRAIIVGLLEISMVSYGSLFLFNIFPHINYIFMLLILISYFVLSISLIKVILDVKIKETLNKRYGQNFQISKVSRYLSSYPVVVFAIVVFAAYFYRTTKSAFILTQNESPVSFLYNIVGGVGFLLIGLSISLLPTLLFDGELFIRGKILQNHSEYFRKEYEFTKEEWYGE
ncbi:hypothetical protein OGZ37_04105 [Lactococcus lactis]|uniref:hypothetical protein n=1 Tax=Lactococcus lactis TaxID=1358 RepID=UPI0024183323|nr:hypothetical protein [Lactococcus lactis]MDG4965762.1 hypothetical protein [Lactococcus lactis]